MPVVVERTLVVFDAARRNRLRDQLRLDFIFVRDQRVAGELWKLLEKVNS